MPKSRDHASKLTLKIGDQMFTLVFKGASREIVPFFQFVYRGFLVNDREGDYRLDVCPVPKTGRELFGLLEDPEKDDEYALTREQLTGWIRGNRKWAANVPFSDGSIGVQSMNGLLVYTPERTCGSVFLPQKDLHPYRSLYRLFWIYFTQVIGEQGACFLHAASIEKGEEGFVFIGGTGTGKSTLARLAGNGAALGDEAPVVAGGSETLRVYPSPYHQMDPEYTFGKNQIVSGISVRSLYFIIRDDETFVEPVSKTDAVAMIMARYIHFFFFISPEARVKIFDLFYHTCHKFPIYCLHYEINTDVWKVIPPN